MDVREKQSSEKRLIDREALLSFEKMDAELCATCGEHHTAEDVIMMIKTAPTVDAVEVVRCKDCKHCDPENHHCDHPMGTAAPLRRKPDDFCSYGERKEGAENG